MATTEAKAPSRTAARKPAVQGADRSSAPRGKRTAATAKARTAAMPAGGGSARAAWARALKAGLLAMVLAAVAASVLVLWAGHAPSWRSLRVVCLQSAPLLFGVALMWRGLEKLRRRYGETPLPLWVGLAVLATGLTMLLSSGLVFAVQAASIAYAEDFDGEMKAVHYLFGALEAFALYLSTAFRLWWPWGMVVPLAVAALFWRSERR